jgi:hypothetical protein
VNIEPDRVASNLQAEYGLHLLTLSLDRTSGDPVVLFDLRTRSGGESAALLTAPIEQIGLPRAETQLDQHEQGFRVPEYVIHALASVLRGSEAPAEPLWLRFSVPSGLLPVIPWERLLQPHLGVSILRLPYHPILTPAPQRSLDSVICFSSPKTMYSMSAEAIADAFVRQIPTDLAAYTTFHLFADTDVQPVLAEVKKEFGDKFDINVYDPHNAPSAISARSRKGASSANAIQNPWLVWMRDALDGRSADIVHFLCHCYLNRADGALALSESPSCSSSEGCTGLIFAAELADFLDATGAWSVAFTSPPSNTSAVGMRMLQDQVARLRPGPCLLHDMGQPDSAKGLREAYRFLYVRSWQPPPNSPTVALYCHPYREMQDVQSDPASERLISEYTLVGRVPELLKSAARPAWVATAQRVLEQNIGAFSIAPENAERAAVVDGQKNAVRFVADMLARHAQADDTPDEEEKK